MFAFDFKSDRIYLEEKSVSYAENENIEEITASKLDVEFLIKIILQFYCININDAIVEYFGTYIEKLKTVVLPRLQLHVFILNRFHLYSFKGMPCER